MGSANPIAVIAVGGNSLAPRSAPLSGGPAGESGSREAQQKIIHATCMGIAAVLATGYRVVVTHGNGPQVGEKLLRGELAVAQLPTQPLDACVAETQGELGYLLQQALDNVLLARGLVARVVSLVTQVLVDAEDPAFRSPDKPIGPFYSPQEAQERMRTFGWQMMEDAGRGWRRVVPSPRPLEIVELHAIRACLEAGEVVIAAGGGGIPVVRRAGQLHGVEAVVDKDRASALLAKCLGAQLLVFSTAVPCVSWHYGRPDERPINRISWEEASRFLQFGEFPAGSMGPKIEAALDYLANATTVRLLRQNARPEAPGACCRVLITSPERIADALAGRAGTEILPPAHVRDSELAIA
jgi:carbamate kinase